MINKKYIEHYLSTQKVMMHYVSRMLPVPADVKKEAEFALVDLRAHLDRNNVRMPPARYFYNVRDKSTWKYIQVNHGDRDTINPGYAYENAL